MNIQDVCTMCDPSAQIKLNQFSWSVAQPRFERRCGEIMETVMMCFEL